MTADRKRDQKSRNYKPVTFATMQQMIHGGRFDETMRKADGGNLAPLSKYLHAFLPTNHADAIAAFHQRRLRRDLSPPLTASQVAAGDIVAIAKGIKLGVKQCGGRIRKGDYRRFIDRATELLALDGELNCIDHDQLANLNDWMLNALRRGKKRAKA
jgi:hypothetical protein